MWHVVGAERLNPFPVTFACQTQLETKCEKAELLLHPNGKCPSTVYCSISTDSSKMASTHYFG
jgi:hypothetical protein